MVTEASFLTVLDISEMPSPQVPENIIVVCVCILHSLSALYFLHGKA